MCLHGPPSPGSRSENKGCFPMDFLLFRLLYKLPKELYSRGPLRWTGRPLEHDCKNGPPFGQFLSYKNGSYICVNGNEFYVLWHLFLAKNDN